MTTTPSTGLIPSVRDRYARGASETVPELCCPVNYDARWLEALPAEILERDYGCGDPSRHVRKGDVVLDLGSGSGKICYIASQITGPEGRVIGVDATPEMLALARRHRGAVGDRVGWHNVEFRRGHIQDLALDLQRLEEFLSLNPVRGVEDLERLRAEEQRLRTEEPLVADASVDLVLSNCVLNLVDDGDKERLFAEIRRVLRPGGRCAIADIVSDEDVPARLKRDPELWSGCISGALREDRFVQAFADAGLQGVRIVERQAEPWAVVEGIEFRSVTVEAWRVDEGACLDHGDAVIYRGPWARVVDDEGHVLLRGTRTAVCRRTAGNLARGPWADEVLAVPPLVDVPAGSAPPFDCAPGQLRSPAETKRGVQRTDVAPGCGPSCC